MLNILITFAASPSIAISLSFFSQDCSKQLSLLDQFWQMYWRVSFASISKIINSQRLISNHYILFLIMKLSIYQGLLLLIIILVAAAQPQPTHLSYFVEYEVEQEDDYIQVQLQIESQSRSLVEALNIAKATASEVTTLANNYCKEHSKKSKGDCKEAVEISEFQIEPKYQMVRKQATFSTFVVKHQVTINVYHTEAIGYLIDSFLKYPDLTLSKFEWLALNEVDSEEAAIKEGLEQGEGLCEQVGLTLGRVISIEQINDEDEDAPAQEEGEEEQEEQEQPEIVTYKFQVECVAKKPKVK